MRIRLVDARTELVFIQKEKATSMTGNEKANARGRRQELMWRL
jgi:hypothetical protein